jgi:hypothetical protein
MGSLQSGRSSPSENTTLRSGYKGYKYNFLIEWGGGSETWEPLFRVLKDVLITCARYAKENDLLDIPDSKKLKKIATREKVQTDGKSSTTPVARAYS